MEKKKKKKVKLMDRGGRNSDKKDILGRRLSMYGYILTYSKL